MKNLAIGFLPTLLVLASGCMIVDHHGHPGCIGDACGEEPADISFLWNFELSNGHTVDSCYMADVARIEIEIFDEWGNLEFATAPDRPCEDLGATITDFLPGNYELTIRGVCPSGAYTHEGFWNLEVYSGYLNDFGVLTLPYLGPCL